MLSEALEDLEILYTESRTVVLIDDALVELYIFLLLLDAALQRV